MKLVEMMPDIDPVVNNEIDRLLLEVLVCPLTRGPLVYDRANNELISHQARKAYPVRAGVPIMLVDEARALGGDE
jgi:hypothetical protein